jgi:hypothetical protein
MTTIILFLEIDKFICYIGDICNFRRQTNFLIFQKYITKERRERGDIGGSV